MKKRMNELSNMVFMLLRKHEIYDDKLYEISDELSHTHESVTSLSSSIDLMIETIKTKNNEKVYPTPSLAEMISSTIKEQISIETSLSHNMRIASKSSVEKIITNVIQTYPHINEEYITKKCLAIIETAVSTDE
jgi:predicted regulator of amino acid metabolism with ACT domain